MKFYKLEITTLEPIIIGFDNSTECRDIISGTALRGMFINENKSEFDNEGEIVLSKDIIFTDAYLVESNNYFVPTPKVFLCNKHEMKKLSSGEKPEIDIFNSLVDDNNKLENISNKFVTLSTEKLKSLSVDKTEKMHINKNLKDGIESLYRYEAISNSQTFYSIVMLKKEDIIQYRHLKKLEGKKLLGRSKRTGYGKVDISIKEITNYSEFISNKLNFKKSTKDSLLKIYFLTDAILKDRYGNIVSILPIEEIEEIFCIEDVEIGEKQFVANKIVGGYNSTKKIPMPKLTAVEAGSVLTYKYSGEITEEKIKDIEHRGLGYFRERGFGRVIINPDFSQNKLEKFQPEKSNMSSNNPITKSFDKEERDMLELINNCINEIKQVDTIEKILTDEESLNKHIKVQIEAIAQINSLIEILESGEYIKDSLSLRKQALYEDREKISIFGEKVSVFLESLSNHNVDKYLKRLEIYEKYSGKTEEEKLDFVLSVIITGLYYKIREE